MAALLALGLLAGAGFVVKVGLEALPQPSRNFSVSTQCVATSAGREVVLDPEQAANAATIAAVGIAMRFGPRAVTIALATAMQESKLMNLRSGDRDSQGLFQQRPSQGWGTPAQVRDPIHASRRFYSRLSKVPRWSSLPLTQAAQAVQRSAYPSAYAKHGADAAILSAALTGTSEAAMTCQFRSPKLAAQPLGANGLTTRAERVRAQLTAAFGRLPTGGYAAGGVSTGHMAGSAHYVGRAVDVSFTPADALHQRRGWAAAAWLVTHAQALGIRTIIYDGRVWTSDRSRDGWRTYASPQGAAGDPDVLAHRDHVHVDVA